MFESKEKVKLFRELYDTVPQGQNEFHFFTWTLLAIGIDERRMFFYESGIGAKTCLNEQFDLKPSDIGVVGENSGLTVLAER